MPARSKIKPPPSGPQPFNQRAHPIVRGLIDAAELWAIDQGLCDPQNAEDFVAVTYIVENGVFLDNATYNRRDNYGTVQIIHPPPCGCIPSDDSCDIALGKDRR